MCHSPSGAFWVQAPDRACWASADSATATERPVASPPDTTFCAKRFITNLREKGDSPALLPFEPNTETGLALWGCRPAELAARGAALECREHPPAERVRGAETAASQRGPLDGLGGALPRSETGRTRLKEGPRSGEPAGIDEGLTLVLRGGMAPPEYFRPTATRRAHPQRIQQRRDDASEWEKTHQIPQG